VQKPEEILVFVQRVTVHGAGTGSFFPRLRSTLRYIAEHRQSIHRKMCLSPFLPRERLLQRIVRFQFFLLTIESSFWEVILTVRRDARRFLSPLPRGIQEGS
jgi:hypothetical protein